MASRIDDFLDGLKQSERYVAYFLAIDAGEGNNLFTQRFMDVFGVSNGLYDKVKQRMESAGYLSRMSWFYSRFVFSSVYRIDVIRHLFKTSPSLYPRFIRVFSGSESITSFLSVMNYVFTGSNVSVRVTLTRSVADSLRPYYEEPWIDRALEFLTDDDLAWYVDNTLYSSTVKGHLLSRETVERLCTTDRHSPGLRDELLGLKILYLYLAYGDFNDKEAKSARNPWIMTTRAIRSVLAGDYENALTLFNAAIRLLNRMSETKNVYIDMFPQYFWILAMIHVDDETQRTKIMQFIKKKESDEYASLRPVRLLARAFLNDQKVPNDGSLSRLINSNYGADKAMNIVYMAVLIDRYFEARNTTGRIEIPTYAIMRHELSAFLDLSAGERECLRSLYGDKPALTSIYRKKEWELVIDDIIQTMNLNSDTVGPVKSPLTSRIIYVRTYGDSFEPKVQTVLKSGAWSKGKLVSRNRFYEHSVEGMTELDKNLARIMQPNANSYREHNEAHDILPYLVGSDRVFYTDAYNILYPIEVEESKPYIKVEKDDNGTGYIVRSNITLESLSHMSNGCVTVAQSNKKYLVIPISDGQKKVYRRLLSSPNFPPESKTALQNFLARLDEVIEVKSELLKDSELENVDGKSNLVVKVEPNTGMMYTIGLYTKPLAEGALYCNPGVGKNVVYDRVGDRNYRVKRNLKAENDLLHEVIDVLDSPEHPVSDENVMNIEAEQLLTLLDFVRQNPDKASVEWPQGKGVILRQPLSRGVWNVGIKANNGWFDIEGDVRLDDDTVIKMSSLLELIAAEKGRFIRLGENDFVEIDKKLRRQLERIEALAVKNHNKMQISTLNAALLDNATLNAQIKIAYDDSLVKLQQRIAESQDVSPVVPRTLNATLRPYQEDGYQWMSRLAHWGAGACLADDMGLGKTVQTIAFLLSKAKEGPALIVAPASVVPNWANELARFAPSLDVAVLNKVDDRKGAIASAKKSAVVLTSYGLLNTESDELSAKKWTTVCLDEAHTIKNRETKMSKAAMALTAKYRLALTGTPIQNHLGELWNLFNFINPGLLGSFEAFRTKYVTQISQNNDKDRRKSLQRIIKPFMLRRTKAEVIDDLPDKTDIVLPVELSAEELAMYEAMRNKAVEMLEKADKLDVNVLSEITKLRRAACSVQLVDKDWTGANAKVQAFLELVHDFKGDNNRMLVFSQFTSFLDIVREALDQTGEKYLYLDGSTSLKQRERLVEEFQQGECPLFLISLKAGGLGLNLTAANYVVHLDPWWNPAIEQQATDRTYRIGQDRNVTVYHLLAKNTIEEKISRLHQTKRDLADSLLEGTDMAAKLTVKDVLEMVNSEE